MHKNDEKTLALAAIIQCCQEVRSIALNGQYDSQILQTAIDSILATEAEQTIDIFGSIASLKSGLRYIKDYHINQTKHDVEQTKYIIISMTLSSKLLNNKNMLNLIAKDIEQIKDHKKQYNELRSNLCRHQRESC